MINELDEVDLAEIARLIMGGFSSGKLDNGEGKHIAWELRADVWKDDD